MTPPKPLEIKGTDVDLESFFTPQHDDIIFRAAAPRT